MPPLTQKDFHEMSCSVPKEEHERLGIPCSATQLYYACKSCEDNVFLSVCVFPLTGILRVECPICRKQVVEVQIAP